MTWPRITCFTRTAKRTAPSRLPVIEGAPCPRKYSGARQLLVEFFKHQDEVAAAVKKAPKFPAPKVAVGVDRGKEEAELFLNAHAYAEKRE